LRIENSKIQEVWLFSEKIEQEEQFGVRLQNRKQLSADKTG